MVITNDIDCKTLTANDLCHVAEIHQLAFPDSLLCSFGKKSIIKYYDWQMRPPNICFAIGAFNNNNDLIGFSFSGVFCNAELFFIKRHIPYFVLHILTHPKLVFDKRIYRQVRKSLDYVKEYRSKKHHMKIDSEMMKEKTFGILSTAVSPNHQGSGIGKLLTLEVEKYARKNNYQSISMSVHKDNQASIKLHENLGYKKVISMEGTWQGIMNKEMDE